MPLLGWYRESYLVPYWGRDFLFYNDISAKAEMERVRVALGAENRRLVRAEAKKHGNTLRSRPVNPYGAVAGTGHTSARYRNQVKGFVPFIRVVPREASSLVRMRLFVFPPPYAISGNTDLLLGWYREKPRP